MISEQYLKYFEPDKLKGVFIDKVLNSKSVGVDKISARKFEKNLSNNVKYIYETIKSGKYKFSPYKVILINKGIGRIPRKICIPTVKDRIVIATLKNIIFDCYNGVEILPRANNTVKKVCESINEDKYKCFFKLDVKTFFDSIDHEILLELLELKIKDSEIIDIISKAIKSPQKLEEDNRKERAMNVVGLPQGVAISSLLANIYLKELDDENMYDSNDYKYWRYVDDILVLCNEKMSQQIQHNISRRLNRRYLLELNNTKTQTGSVTDKINYLGYSFKDGAIRIRQKSVQKIERRLENTFKEYFRSEEKNLELLIWKLNLRITGALSNNTRFGWLFYFSQITDLSVLKHLDHLVDKFVKRFNINLGESNIKIKKFLRAYNEIKNNLKNTKYIINYDEYGITEMENICIEIFKIDTSGFEPDQIERVFRKRMFSELRDIEKDLDALS